MSAIRSASGGGGHGGAQLAQEVNVAVAKKAQDAAKAQGEAAISLLQAAAEVAQQGNAASGKGQKIDIHG